MSDETIYRGLRIFRLERASGHQERRVSEIKNCAFLETLESLEKAKAWIDALPRNKAADAKHA